MIALTTSTTDLGGPALAVQVTITGLTAGQGFRLEGVSDLGEVWPVPGGVGTASASSVSRLDNRTPTESRPFRYRVIVEGASYESSTLSIAGPPMLQSLTGRAAAPFEWVPNRLPRESASRSVLYDVPGRRRPPGRYAPRSDSAGELVVRTTRLGSLALDELLRTGEPVVLRSGGRIDLQPVELLSVGRVASRTAWDVTDVDPDRTWTLQYMLADDPQPTAVLSAWTWDDFDAAMLSRTWADFDALFAGQTWADFDAYPWGQL